MSEDELIFNLYNYAKNFSSASEFIKNPEVKNYILNLEEVLDSKTLYFILIEIMITNFVSVREDGEKLNSLLINSIDLTIYNYRQYLLFKGNMLYDTQESSNKMNLSRMLMDSIASTDYETTVEKYKKDIESLASIIKVDTNYIKTILNSYYVSLCSQDKNRMSKLSAIIKEYVRKYNAILKTNYANSYANQNIDKIREFFALKEQAQTGNSIDLSIIVRNYIERYGIELSNEIFQVFNIYIEQKKLEEFVTNFSKKDALNYEILNLDEPVACKKSEAIKVYSRIEKNFLPILNKAVTPQLAVAIRKFLCGDESVKNLISKCLQKTLRELRCLIVKLDCEVMYNAAENKFYLSNFDTELTQEELNEIESYNQKCKLYAKMKKKFVAFKGGSNSPRIITKYDESVFSDYNYESTEEYYYLRNFEFMADFIDQFEAKDIDVLEFEHVKKFLMAIIPCLIVDADFDNIKFLVDFICNANKFNREQKFCIEELQVAFKLSTFYDYVNEIILSTLGENVCKKLIFNTQFIERKNDKELISLRLQKAVYTMYLAHQKKTSSIPYFEDIEYKNIILSRYNEADEEILTSGIDTNTCFKLDGNDNDYILYSILSSNGLIVKIIDKNSGNICGRMTANLYFNVLIINGIRVSGNEYIASSLEEEERNQNIVEAVKILAQKLIELTSNTPCPIDFVLTNKAGILESNLYLAHNEIIEGILDNSIDTFNDDFESFKNMFKEHPEYLFQLNPNSESSFYGKPPFTTDFGSYPLILVEARQGKRLNRRWDIASTPQESIFERPSTVYSNGTGKIPREHLSQCSKIKSFVIFKTENMGGGKLFVDLSKSFQSYTITDSSIELDGQLVLKL